VNLLTGGISPDQGYSFWSTGGPTGSGAIEGEEAGYVRYPDGHSAPIGRGSLGVDPAAEGLLISEGGGHILFRSGVGTHPAVQLEPEAPPSGTEAIYDRTPDEVTHVVSLLPGEVTPGEKAAYRGASLDGRGVAFSIGSKLYLRYEDAQTFEIGTALTFEGVSEGGARLFYLKGGDLYRFDAQSEETTRFSETGDATAVNISADGSAAYFVSPTVLAAPPGPQGDAPVAGGQNLYLSSEGAISFLGRLSKEDVEGEYGGTQWQGALGRWGDVVSEGHPGTDPSRSSADGSILLFESNANLTGFDSEGHREVYRYEAGTETLACLSCLSTGASTSGDGTLQSVSQGLGSPQPLLVDDTAVNLSANGKRAAFQSPEPLVGADTDGVQDVYEWEAQNEGSCHTQGGCTYLISSGESADPNYLFGISDDGSDVFFTTTDLLVPERDPNETASIYDARIEGGFPPPAAGTGECLGEACQPAAVAPNDPTPASSAFEGAGNVKEEVKAKARCPKGKRAMAKGRCAPAHKKHKKKGPRKRAKTERRAGR
jgi:hypothetical protein